MKRTDPLYHDRDITIDYSPHNVEDHSLTLHTPHTEDIEYIIARGCLAEIAKTPRNSKTGNDLEELMRRVNETMIADACQRGLSIDSLGFAMIQAYVEEEGRIENERFLRHAMDTE